MYVKHKLTTYVTQNSNKIFCQHKVVEFTMTRHANTQIVHSSYRIGGRKLEKPCLLAVSVIFRISESNSRKKDHTVGKVMERILQMLWLPRKEAGL